MNGYDIMDLDGGMTEAEAYKKFIDEITDDFKKEKTTYKGMRHAIDQYIELNKIKIKAWAPKDNPDKKILLYIFQDGSKLTEA